MFRIDAHTHVFPDSVMVERAALCSSDTWFGLLYENPLARLATVEDLIDSMDVAGIDHSVICGFPWRDTGVCDVHNGYMQEAAQRYPGRLSWLGIVSPAHGGRSAKVAVDLFNRGAAGIGELNADAQGFDLEATGKMTEAFEVCSELQKPVLLHASEPVGHFYPGKGSATPARFLNFVSSFPDLRVVAAHWGGGLPFYELMPEVRLAARNVVYDSAASTYLYDFNVFRTVIDLAGRDKVLFGSDFPVLRQDRFVRRVSSVEWSCPDEELAVMAGNAARTYGISLQGITQP